MKRHSKKRSKLISLWSLSYCILLVFFVVSIIAVSLVNRSVSRKINDKYCQALFSGISQNATELIEQSNLIYSTLVNYEKLGEVMAIDKIDDYYLSNSVLALIENLGAIKGKVDFYVYFPKTDTVMSNLGFFESDAYYKNWMQQYGLEYDEWQKKFHDDGTRGAFSVSSSETSDIFLREKYITKQGKRLYLITKISEAALLNVEELPEWIDESDIYISNLNGEIYMTRGDRERIEKCSGIEDINNVYGEDWEIFEKTEFLLLPMTVTIVYPKQAAWFELNLLARIQIWMSAILILLSLGVIIFVIRRNYKPIASIMKLLDTEDSGDEIDGIQKGIHELLSMNKYYLKQVEKLSNENVQAALAKCLSGNCSQSEIKKLMEEHSISFPYKYFTLCAFAINNIEELFADDEVELSTEQKFKDLTFMLHNIFSELFAQYDCHVKIATVEDRIFAIINIKEEIQYNCSTVYEVLKYGLDFIKKHFSVECSFVLTKLYSSVSALPESYSQALYLLRYKSAMEIARPIGINDIEYGSESKAEVLLDCETEQKLVNYIVASDFENANFLLEHIFSGFSDRQLSFEQKQCLMIDIGCMLCKIPQSEVKVEFDKILDYSANVTAMKEYIRTIVKKMCESITPTVFKTDKIEQIKEFIDTKYYENIDLNSLGYMFGVSQNYLSALFKKEVGMPITNYINMTRIKNAKQLLKNTDKSVKDIAEKVGYKNIRTFNRVFQKYEGVSPTIYRNNIK